MKKLISLFAFAAASSAFAEIITVDFNTPPSSKESYTTGDYYFDLTNVPADTIYNSFVDINAGDETAANDANALFEIGADSAINLGFWTWFQAKSAGVNGYSSNEDFSGVVWKFNVGESGQTGYMTTNLSGGSQNSQIQGLKLFDFENFDTSVSKTVTQEIFKAGTWSSFNSNSEWAAMIEGAWVDLTYNSTTTFEGANGIYNITLTEYDSFRSDKYENSRWVEYTLEFTSFNPIPEPSTYAAVFGALALGFAMYRRRK